MKANGSHTEWNSSSIGTPDIAGNPEDVNSTSEEANTISGEKHITYSTDYNKYADKEEAAAASNPRTAKSNEIHPPEDSGFHHQIDSMELALPCHTSKMPEGGNDKAENSTSSADAPTKAFRAKYNSSNRCLPTTSTNLSFNSINRLDPESSDSGSFILHYSNQFPLKLEGIDLNNATSLNLEGIDLNDVTSLYSNQFPLNLEGIDLNNVTSGSTSKENIHCCPDIQQLQMEKIELEKQLQAKILEHVEEINTLRQLNHTYKEHINELQEKTSDAEATKEKFTKVIKESNIIFDALTDDLKKKKSSTWIDVLSWPFTYRSKRKCDENNVISKIESVCDTVKNFDTKFNHQQQIIEKQEAQIKSLNVDLHDARDKCKDTEEHFNKKLVKQVNILKRKDAELDETKIEHQKEMESLKETIDKLNSEVKHSKETSKTLSNTLISNRKELSGANDEILSLKQENSNLKQRLEQNIYQLKRLCEKKSDLDLQVYQTKEEVEKLKQKLNDVKVAVQNQVSTLKMEEEKFKNLLVNISGKIKTQQNLISLKENAEQAEKYVINNALARICNVKEEVKNIEDQIYAFSGNSENRMFLTLKEKLVRAVTKLDSVESESKEQILTERKECIVYVTGLLNVLESRVGK